LQKKKKRKKFAHPHAHKHMQETLLVSFYLNTTDLSATYH